MAVLFPTELHTIEAAHSFQLLNGECMKVGCGHVECIKFLVDSYPLKETLLDMSDNQIQTRVSWTCQVEQVSLASVSPLIGVECLNCQNKYNVWSISISLLYSQPWRQCAVRVPCLNVRSFKPQISHICVWVVFLHWKFLPFIFTRKYEADHRQTL